MNSANRHGYGTLRDPTGEIYSGDWVNDEWTGTGRLKNRNMVKLLGQFNYKNFDQLENYWDSYSG